MEHRAVCLLNRRYDLAATGYKYLKIGINLGPSYVEIALEDHRGHELSLSLEGPLQTKMEYLQGAETNIKIIL